MTDHAPLVEGYYSVFAGADPAALRALLAAGWTNTSSPGDVVGVEEFLGRLAGLRASVPDLAWRVDDVIDAGDRLIVRGEGSGTPVGALFGTPVSGRAFRILSLDVHTIENGLIASTFHLEDWAGALSQVGAAR